MKQYDEDTRCIERTLNGDQYAFTQLVDRYQEQVFRLVCSIVGREEDARDVAQDVFVKVYSHLRKFDGRSAFATWLYRIACNTALSAVRRQRETVPTDERLLSNIPDNEADALFACEADEMMIAALNRAIGRLAPDERAFVTLFYYEERTMAECAAIFGLTENNAKVRLHRIRKKLYSIIKNDTTR